MKRLALVDQNGLIVNIVSVPDDWTDEDPRWQPPGNLSAVDVPDAAPGDTWDGSKRVRKPSASPRDPADTKLAFEDLERLLRGLGVTQGQINQAKRDRGKPMP